MWAEAAFLILGFIVLVKGADLLVDGAGSIAKRFGISELVIGLTIVAFGTSAPELVVNLLSAFSGSTELALGNIIGSNISNTLLILGITAVISPLVIKRNTVWQEIPLVLIASLAVFFLVNDLGINGAGVSAVSRTDGLTLLLFFGIFIYYSYGVSQKEGGADNPDIKSRHPAHASLMSMSGVAGLVLGGKWIVDSATTIAYGFGISETIVGLTLLALGTSLPELATSAVAAWRGNPDIAVGNVVGSNIFNLLFVLAITSLVSPLPLGPDLNKDIWVMIIAAGMLLLFAFIGRKKRQLERWEGYVFLACYFVYILWLAFRAGV